MVLGTFNATSHNQSNHIAITGTSSNSSKKSRKSVSSKSAHGEDTKANPKDIRAMFAKIAQKNVSAEPQKEQRSQ